MKLKIIDYLIFILFLIYLFLNICGLNTKELQGDEATYLIAVLPAMKFYVNPKYLASILLMGHMPLTSLLEVPLLAVFGLREIWLYLPFVIMSLSLFWLIYSILKQWIGKTAALTGVVLLAINGSIVLQRTIMGIAPYLFFSSLFLIDFHSFLASKNHLKFIRSLIYLFFTVLSYAEGVIFIPVMIFWLWKKSCLKDRRIKRGLLAFSFVLGLFFFLWTIVPFIAYKRGYIQNLNEFGFVRIFFRASGQFQLNLFHLVDLLSDYNSLFFVWFLIAGMVLSLLDKKSLFFWSFFILPLTYFSFKQVPAVHLFNYLNLMIITSSSGWQKLFHSIRRYFLIKSLLVCLIVIICTINLRYLWQNHYRIKTSTENAKRGDLLLRGLKSTAYTVRKNTDKCDKIYTDIEGYVFRIYFGRTYTANKNEAKAIILKKDLQLNKEYTKLFDKEFASFDNFMPYLTCKN